ncbi:MAG: HAMP domain-containing sensor histidine kinase [Eubacteriales bacterium]|jgi:HAMP domain-containing protein
MFKSNFSRNLAAFALLIFLAFSAITLVSTFVVLDNARNDRIATSKRLADAVFDDIHDGLKTYNGSFTATVLHIQNQNTYSDRFAAVLNSNIFITDKNGFILYSSTPAYHNAFRVESKFLKKYASYPGETHCSTFGGIFDSEYFVSAFPIDKENASSPDDIFGIVFICSPADSVINTVKQIITLVLTALFWVFLASVLALYFISKRLNVPLMRLKDKFSLFSSGDYSVRMPKTGVTEVDRIGDAFNEMASILEVTENSRRMFLCNISHDLRTPMTSIQGFTEAILDGTLPPERHHYYLVLIHKEIKRLSGIVNELLDISKIESGTLQLNKSVFDICEMVRLIIISLEEKLLAKNIEFHLEAQNSHSYVLADKDSMYQVIYNLLDNAAKFSDNNGTIRVTVLPEMPEDTNKNRTSEAKETAEKPEKVSKTDKKKNMRRRSALKFRNIGSPSTIPVSESRRKALSRSLTASIKSICRAAFAATAPDSAYSS